MKPSRVVEFMEKMEPNSVAVFASAHEIKRNHDTDFEFRQDTDFYYLTRLNEPDCVAVLAPSHPEHKSTSFPRSCRNTCRTSKSFITASVTMNISITRLSRPSNISVRRFAAESTPRQ